MTRSFASPATTTGNASPGPRTTALASTSRLTAPTPLMATSWSGSSATSTPRTCGSTSTPVIPSSPATIRWIISSGSVLTSHIATSRTWRPSWQNRCVAMRPESPPARFRWGVGSTPRIFKSVSITSRRRVERRALDRVLRLRPEHPPERRVPPRAACLISASVTPGSRRPTFPATSSRSYVRELAPLSGENVLRDSPLDHKHHAIYPEIRPADFLTRRREFWTGRLHDKNP
jgi:hypothetical protein